MASRKNVPAAEVRDWARANGHTVGSRGRLNPTAVEAFHKANKGKRYTPKVAQAATVTVPVKSLDKSGRATTRKVTISTPEARDLLGQSGKRGRFDKGLLAMAIEARDLS